MTFQNGKQFWITNFGLTIIVNLVVLFASIQRWTELKIILWRSVWLITLVVYISVISLCLIGINLIIKPPKTFVQAVDHLSHQVAEIENKKITRFIAGLIALGILFLIPVVKIQLRVGETIKNSTIDPELVTILFYWFLWWVLWAGIWLTKIATRQNWGACFAIFSLSAGISYEIFNRLGDVNTYPFSLGWSEASRYYYGSLVFAEELYGLKLPLSILHPSRYLLQSIPFLWDDTNILTHRAWQFFLWIGLLFFTSLSLVQKILKTKFSFLFRGLLTLFIFLFFLKIGVYYHLAPIIFLPLLFYSTDRPVSTLTGILLGSIWAGISRINWIPVPAVMVSLLYILDQTRSNKTFVELIRLPFIWGAVGLISALTSQYIYLYLSGNQQSLEAAGSSFTSSLLWNRLFPSDSNPLGVLIWIGIYALPFLYALRILVLNSKFNKTQNLFALFTLLVFFLGGLLVSVKIGGGADLHNMDGFALFLVFIPLIYLSSANNLPDINAPFSWAIVVMALISPLIFTIPNLRAYPEFHEDYNQSGVRIIKNLAEQKAKTGEVLFINERHLITYGMIDVPLVHDYEAVTLMEMVMSGNSAYLERFNQDISTQRFSAIVSAKLNTVQKTEGQFFEENNLWNSLVASKILCYYEPLVVRQEPEPTSILEADETKLEFLIPRTNPGDCN
ncbi:MAG TPA: hypothetical protein VN226_06735 [Anaerolineales bacterium]|nr:hypothetical protein [Anaerolineales bacterium]